nr:hypothetical protein [Microbulbifer elongatus]
MEISTMLHRFFILSIALVYSGPLHTMSIFEAGKVCTFSGVSGVILQRGAPLGGAKVTRTTDFQKKRKMKQLQMKMDISNFQLDLKGMR